MKWIIVLSLLFFFISSPVFANEKQGSSKPMSAEQIQKLDSIEKAKEALDKLQQLTDSITRQKYYDCLMAFGDQIFCQCIADNLPVSVSFELYVRIVKTSKDELGYSELDQENKSIVDVTLNVREKCVGK